MILLLLPTAKCVDLSYSKNGVLEIAVRWVPALISNFDKKPARLPALISNVSKKSAGRGRGRRSGSPADVAPMGTRLRVAAAGQTADRARRRSNCRPQVRTELINQSLRWLTSLALLATMRVEIV